MITVQTGEQTNRELMLAYAIAVYDAVVQQYLDGDNDASTFAWHQHFGAESALLTLALKLRMQINKGSLIEYALKCGNADGRHLLAFVATPNHHTRFMTCRNTFFEQIMKRLDDGESGMRDI